MRYYQEVVVISNPAFRRARETVPMMVNALPSSPVNLTVGLVGFSILFIVEQL